MAVVIETTIGDFTVDLYTDERPQTCRNFLKLCKVKYYNWNLFHTVQRNFIAQTGDPTGTGKGGSSVYGIVLGEEARYYEAEQMPKIKHDKTGLLSMVNCGNNMLASQFFITLASDLQSLDGEHCVFGEIAEGLEIILKLNETICDGEHRPYQDIRISHTVILEDPFDDPEGLVIPDRSPKPTKEALMSDRIGADELIDDTAGMSVEEITEMQKEKEAKARATILEIVGDIPDADMAPPENVLFVCKLNPVTTDDDLEIIFSRFGQIVGCEVIRDRQTGDSLQYAFIEFGNRKSCEEAYFKMDNVLIDDRRIHVDFSQSVAKMRWRGKGKGIKYFDDAGNEEEKKKLQENTKSKSREESRNKKDYRSKNDYRGEDRNAYVSRKERIVRNEREYSRNGQKYRGSERYQEYSRERYYADSRQERDYRRKPSEMFSNRRENKYRDRPSERSSDRSIDRRREESRSGNLEKHSKRKLSPSRETKKDKSQRRESKKHGKKEKRSKKESSSSSSSSDSDDESLSDSSDDSEDSDSSDSSSSSVSSESDNNKRKKKHAKHHRDHHQRKSTQRKHKGKKKRPR